MINQCDTCCQTTRAHLEFTTQKTVAVNGGRTAQARDYVRRIEFHSTPKHGSWLNIAENELSCLTCQCFHGRHIGDLIILQQEIEAWSIATNDLQRGVDWHMTIEDARDKLKSVYPENLL